MKAVAPTIFIAVVLLTVAVIAEAQQPGKSTRIGYLDNSTAAGSLESLDDFRKQMTHFNWIEGKNLTIEYRYAEGKLDRLSELAIELVALKVDLILVGSTSPALAAKKATSTIPIVMAVSTDPVEVGLIASLARPGGNITGFASFADELAGKRVEILKEVLPKATRIGVITGTGGGGLGAQLQVKSMKEVASSLGLKLVEIGAGSELDNLVNAFQVAVRERVNAIISLSGAAFFGQRKSIIALAASHKLPAIYAQKEYVEDGGLMSYGVDRRDLYRRAAVYVDNILKGAKPADMPVQQATKFEFIINLKAAKQIGLTIPVRVLERADKVIK
jgi:ABC-type uncharacterized transport system substrate-binding protein